MFEGGPSALPQLLLFLLCQLCADDVRYFRVLVWLLSNMRAAKSRNELAVVDVMTMSMMMMKLPAERPSSSLFWPRRATKHWRALYRPT